MHALHQMRSNTGQQPQLGAHHPTPHSSPPGDPPTQDLTLHYFDVAIFVYILYLEKHKMCFPIFSCNSFLLVNSVSLRYCIMIS